MAESKSHRPVFLPRGSERELVVDFDVRLQQIEHWARGQLIGGGFDPGPHNERASWLFDPEIGNLNGYEVVPLSMGWLCSGALWSAKVLRGFVRDRNAAAAAAMAMQVEHLVGLYVEIAMEHDYRIGVRVRRKGGEGGRPKLDDDPRLLSLAVAMKLANPRLSRAEIARRLESRFSQSARTIRGKLERTAVRIELAETGPASGMARNAAPDAFTRAQR